MTTQTTVTPAEADATLAAVIEQFAAYFEPMDLGNGKVMQGEDKPVLVWDYTEGGDPAIVWESGPDEWVHTIHGGTSEQQHVDAAHMAEEFGFPDYQPTPRPPAKIPAGVFVEPVNSVVLGIYPA